MAIYYPQCLLKVPDTSDVIQRNVAMIARGVVCYVLDEKKDELDRIMVYTLNGEVILIEESEIIRVGYN